MIYVASTETFDAMKPGEVKENLRVVLLQGIACKDGNFEVVYHLFKFRYNGETTLEEVVKSNHENVKVLRQLFEENPSTVNANDIHLLYFNQFA